MRRGRGEIWLGSGISGARSGLRRACVAAILSAATMLEHLGVTEVTHEVERAVAAVLAEGKVRTPDLGSTSGTAR